MIRFIALGAALTLAACSEPATVADRQSADYGRAMAQSECETIAKQNILQGLKDPQSARITYGTCEKTVMHSIPIMGIPKQAGYRIVASVNAKNSFGGYTGAQPWVVLMKNGQAIRRTYPHEGAQLPY
ncbi:hypothetical protein [Roseovarius sp. MMSF_3281]|uniref:hypothetical protein n=1 Tax=Roseovarius sp. MMSF_3281 TaxID=3046694 RepID=UPI00274003C6|nr:hypothetical protein [Roseovarius sp. MMSF_3281]